MPLKCEECNKIVYEATDPYNDWLKLFHLLEFLLNEEQITYTTYESALNSLLRFKRYAQEDK